MFVEVKILFGFYETDNSKTKQKKHQILHEKRNAHTYIVEKEKFFF